MHFWAMISANKIPRLGHSFPMKASHTTPKLRANCQYHLKILLHIWINASHSDVIVSFLYPLSVLSSKLDFINAHFWYKTKIFANICSCFSLKCERRLPAVEGGTGCLFGAGVVFGLIHWRRDSALRCQYLVKS